MNVLNASLMYGTAALSRASCCARLACRLELAGISAGQHDVEQPRLGQRRRGGPALGRARRTDRRGIGLLADRGLALQVRLVDPVARRIRAVVGVPAREDRGVRDERRHRSLNRGRQGTRGEAVFPGRDLTHVQRAAAAGLDEAGIEHGERPPGVDEGGFAAVRVGGDGMAQHEDRLGRRLARRGGDDDRVEPLGDQLPPLRAEVEGSLRGDALVAQVDPAEPTVAQGGGDPHRFAGPGPALGDQIEQRELGVGVDLQPGEGERGRPRPIAARRRRSKRRPGARRRDVSCSGIEEPPPVCDGPRISSRR